MMIDYKRPSGCCQKLKTQQQLNTSRAQVLGCEDMSNLVGLLLYFTSMERWEELVQGGRVNVHHGLEIFRFNILSQIISVLVSIVYMVL